jgi:nuclear transcription Y subunit beta
MSSTPENQQGAHLSKNIKEDVAPAQSPDAEEAHMDREGADAQAQGLGYEFEVKEQDRWLPIANGAYTPLPPPAL